MKHKIINIVNYLNLSSAIALTSLSIFHFDHLRIVLYIFFISYFIEIFIEKKWKSITFDKKSIFFLSLAVFFILALIYYPFEQDTQYWSLLISKRLSLLAVGIVGFLGVNKKYKLSYFLKASIVTSTIIISYLILFKIGLIEFITSSDKIYLFSETRKQFVNHHMMFNFYLNISLVSIWYLLSNNWTKYKNYSKISYLLCGLIIFSTLSITEGRSGFLAGILILNGFIFIEIRKRFRIISYLLFPVILFSIILIGSNHQRLTESALKHESRLFLWKSAMVVIQNKPILGYGVSTAQVAYDKVSSIYETNDYKLFTKNRKIKDSHNQYLQTMMEFGVIGIILLVFIYLYPLFIADTKRKTLALFWLFLCWFQSTFDMFITGQFCILFSLLMLFIFSVPDDTREINKKVC